MGLELAMVAIAHFALALALTIPQNQPQFNVFSLLADFYKVIVGLSLRNKLSLMTCRTSHFMLNRENWNIIESFVMNDAHRSSEIVLPQFSLPLKTADIKIRKIAQIRSY